MSSTITITIFIFLSCSSRSPSKITELNLSNKNLTKIPDSVFSLLNPTHLQLGNNFTIYPPLSSLGAGKSPGNNLNKITTIQSEIKLLQELQIFSIRFNDLQSLPKEIARLEKLDTLDLSYNENLNIARELETLKEMTRLKYLNIVATKVDTSIIEQLRKALPKTKIVSKL